MSQASNIDRHPSPNVKVLQAPDKNAFLQSCLDAASPVQDQDQTAACGRGRFQLVDLSIFMIYETILSHQAFHQP
jgi:hypothetical protein